MAKPTGFYSPPQYVHVYCCQCESYIDGHGECKPNSETARTAWLFYDPQKDPANYSFPHSATMIVEDSVRRHSISHHPDDGAKYLEVSCENMGCTHLFPTEEEDLSVGF